MRLTAKRQPRLSRITSSRGSRCIAAYDNLESYIYLVEDAESDGDGVLVRSSSAADAKRQGAAILNARGNQL